MDTDTIRAIDCRRIRRLESAIRVELDKCKSALDCVNGLADALDALNIASECETQIVQLRRIILKQQDKLAADCVQTLDKLQEPEKAFCVTLARLAAKAVAVAVKEEEEAAKEAHRPPAAETGFDCDLGLAQHIADVLNGMLEQDRMAVAALIANRTICNEALAEHPTVQCIKQHGGYWVGLLGFLNGLCGVLPSGRGPIEAVFSTAEPDDRGYLREFRVNVD